MVLPTQRVCKFGLLHITCILVAVLGYVCILCIQFLTTMSHNLLTYIKTVIFFYSVILAFLPSVQFSMQIKSYTYVFKCLKGSCFSAGSEVNYSSSVYPFSIIIYIM